METAIAGGCMCGGVRYAVHGPLRQVVACHCEQCRRSSGHFVAATACRRSNFELLNQETLAWYSAVEGFRRGFCSRCGSSLFFEETGGERVSIAAGSLDKPQGLKIAAHIYTDEAGDYYEIGPGVPQNSGAEHGVMLP
jgi:hypothetical protein